MYALYRKRLVNEVQVETIGKIRKTKDRITSAKGMIDKGWKDWYHKNPDSNINTLLDGTVYAMKANSGCPYARDSCTVVKDYLKKKFNEEANRTTINPLPDRGGRKHKTKKNKKKGKKKTIKRKKGKKKSKKRGKKKTVKRKSKKSRK